MNASVYKSNRDAVFLARLHVHQVKGKGNVGEKYVYQDRTLQAEHFDTSFVKIGRQIRKLLEFKYVRSNCH